MRRWRLTGAAAGEGGRRYTSAFDWLERVVNRVKGALVVAFLRMFAVLPWPAVQAAGRFIGWLMWKLPTRARDVASINLRKCFPELTPQQHQRLVGDSLQGIGQTLTESACAWIWPSQRSLALIREVEGLEILQQALASGKGVVGITSHLGNWELLNNFYASICKPLVFYRPPKLKAVDDLLSEKRIQQGNRAAPSTREGIISVIKEVRRGGAVGIPADPEPAETAGIFVPFCGTQALTSKFVPSMLSGGKALGVFLHAVRLEDGSGHKVIIEAAPEAMYSEDIDEAVAAMGVVLERYVRRWPAQYMWTMKRFKRRPAGEPRWY